MIHDLDKVSYLLVLARLYKPLSEVALDRHVEHLLLLAREASSPDFLLHLNELFCPQLHHLDELGRAEEEIGLAELSWQRHLGELKSGYQGESLAWDSH